MKLLQIYNIYIKETNLLTLFKINIMNKKITNDIFIEKAREIHGDKYDYSKIEYINAKTKVCIICPEHGEFWQFPFAHFQGQGCPKCSGHHRTTQEFIEIAKSVHNDKYDYSKTEYINSSTKVRVICPKHGEFWQMPNNHLRGQGCPICKNEKKSLISTSNTEEFVKKAKQVHGNKYDYSKVKYIDAKTKVCIICPIHGKFYQTPNSHLMGRGCFECGLLSCKPKSLTTEEFIEKARKIHGDKYDYSKVKYVNTYTKICIICPKHGEFWQTPNCHLNGKGCPLCNESHLERDIRFLFDNNKINYEYRKRNFDWLNGLELDFYLPDYNVAIECQGIQHFIPKSFGGNEKSKFSKQIELDELKSLKCKNNGVKLIYYSYKNIVPKNWNKYSVITDTKSILAEIKAP